MKMKGTHQRFHLLYTPGPRGEASDAKWSQVPPVITKKMTYNNSYDVTTLKGQHAGKLALEKHREMCSKQVEEAFL